MEGLRSENIYRAPAQGQGSLWETDSGPVLRCPSRRVTLGLRPPAAGWAGSLLSPQVLGPRSTEAWGQPHWAKQNTP